MKLKEVFVVVVLTEDGDVHRWDYDYYPTIVEIEEIVFRDDLKSEFKINTFIDKIKVEKYWVVIN